MRIYAYHDLSGCGYYRIRLPLGELAKHGHDITCLPGTEVDATAAGTHQIIVGQRMDKYDALPSWRRWAARSRLVYEVDDDVFNTDPVNWMAHRVYGRSEVQDAVAHAVEVADLVTVTTEPLAEVMRKHNPNVAVLPNHIPAALLDIQRPRRDRVVVGWAGGASHGADMAMVAPQLRRLVGQVPVEVHLIGTDYSPTLKHSCRFTAWDDDVTGYYRNIDFDVGIAPLTGSVFDRSKSAIKALEYAALGIPVVASDVEPYRGFVVDGVTGFLIPTDREWLWFKRLRELVNDVDMREEMGAKAREAAAGWTIEAGWHLWETAYRGLL